MVCNIKRSKSNLNAAFFGLFNLLCRSTIEITPEILSLIARVDEFKGAWRALGSLR
jgi:hypothetical protein